jgi:hypothetical protein
MAEYPVAWQTDGGPARSGRLNVGTSGIRLEGGRHRVGRLSARRVLYEDIEEARMAPTDKRLSRRPTVQLRSRNGSLYIAPLGAGLALEILAALRLRIDSG